MIEVTIPTPMQHWPSSAPGLTAYWWTYAGDPGKDCHILAHETKEAAEWHYCCARSIGGNFTRLGMTIRPLDEPAMRRYLGGIFPTIHTVNPQTVRPLARLADNVNRA